MTNIYIVQEVGYEYNDEYYYRVDVKNCGTPLKTFKDLTKAQQRADELSLKFFESGRYENYMGERFYGKRREQMNEALEKLGAPPITDAAYEWQFPKQLPLDKKQAIVQAFREIGKLSFYEVVETEME